jgi:hypothetical protein
MGETDQDVKLGMLNTIKNFILMHLLVGGYYLVICSKLE